MKIENVIIFGIGAAGSNTLNNLVCVHPDLNYTIVDFDKVEACNITAGTQPFTTQDLNRPKVQALARIVQLQRGKRIEFVNKRIETVADIKAIVTKPAATLIIDAFDNAKSRNLFVDLGKGYHVMHIGFSAVLTGEASWDGVFTKMVESKADAAIDVCQLHQARPFINTLTGMATKFASDFIGNGVKKNILLDFPNDKWTVFR